MNLPLSKPLVLVACESLLTAQTLAWGLECHLTGCDLSYVWNAEDLVQRFHAESPKLILLDEGMALRSIRVLAGFVSVRVRQCRIVVLGDELTSSQLSYIAHNRLSGLVSRDRPLPEFARQLQQVMQGRPVLSQLWEQQIQSGTDGWLIAKQDVIQPLSDRQLQVLIRIAQGASVREVAAELKISEKSVESHKYRAMKILGIDDRVDLCRWAIREGLIQA
jgi:DNA-binding NarL/FixJ family response regulator